MTLRHKLSILTTGLAAAAAILPACNSESTKYDGITDSTVAIRSFYLAADDSVMANLDSVYFSIDLVSGQVFNADSLPCGTDVTRLVPVISLVEECSATELIVKRAGKADTTYNYKENSTDSIDFTNPVRLRLVSANGDAERSYTIKVNVHTMHADSLSWTDISEAKLPTSLQAPTAQRTVQQGGRFLCLSTDGQAASLAVSTAPLTGANGRIDPAAWDIRTVTLPAGARTETFSATNSGLYLLDADGHLWLSTDDCATWEPTPCTWHAVTGAYRHRLIGTRQQADGQWVLEIYPDQIIEPLPADMPVSGNSVPVSYSFAMSDSPQALIVGGRKADGTLSRDTWGYDGRTWAKLSKTALPVALEDVAVAPYVTYTLTAGLRTINRATMLAMGGRTADGTPNATVYMSDDYGYHWYQAPVWLQTGPQMGAFYGAQAYVADGIYHADIARVSSDIESWQCPYIYVFGGHNADGSLNGSIWRGVINRYTFKPIQ